MNLRYSADVSSLKRAVTQKNAWGSARRPQPLRKLREVGVSGACLVRGVFTVSYPMRDCGKTFIVYEETRLFL